MQTYSVRRVEMPENRSVYVTLAFAGVALMVALLIGVVVLRKRSSRFPHHQVQNFSTAVAAPLLCLSEFSGSFANTHTVQNILDNR